jgi:hypothetical protein
MVTGLTGKIMGWWGRAFIVRKCPPELQAYPISYGVVWRPERLRRSSPRGRPIRLAPPGDRIFGIGPVKADLLRESGALARSAAAISGEFVHGIEFQADALFPQLSARPPRSPNNRSSFDVAIAWDL